MPDRGDEPVRRGATNQFDEVGDLRGTAAALNNLGAVLWEQNDRTGAREHWTIAGERFARVGDRAGRATALLNMAAAVLANEHGSPAEAQDLLLESLRLNTTQPPARGTGLIHLHLGDAYSRCGDPAAAQDHWQQAHTILTSVNDADAAQARQRLGSPTRS